MNLQELPKLRDRISYLYLEHAVIQQEDASIVAIDKDGSTPIPVGTMSCILLGPGTRITHAAIRAICDNGAMAIWCGERATRFYAAGIGSTRSAQNLLLQAEVCMNPDKHMEAVRRMYALRFPKMNTDRVSLQQIRGMEGARVRKAYELAAQMSGIRWSKRAFSNMDWDDSEPVNRALSEANALLYGVCHAALVSLGYSPGLGFVHTGKMLSFVYDIADLYKTETTIPAAFEAVREDRTDLSRTVRLQCRDRFAHAHILSRIAGDVHFILTGNKQDRNSRDRPPEEPGDLWDGYHQTVSGGHNYAEDSGGELE
ncbi:MAG: type I-E CRISPR-associated endonuclease Cas1 [Clostridia bacterium]|nr:type I-E CRISPR-associated endonuclease Cas1 [Clostridia bacterium]